MAYYVDRGLWYFGSRVEHEVDLAGEAAAGNIKNAANRQAIMNGARARTLDRLLGGKATSAAGFRDPAKDGAL